ncbi:MAG TPA: flagellar basal body-associated FliL family protein [Propionibacteriaceae bacterium]|jgi:flagellar FliL protein
MSKDEKETAATEAPKSKKKLIIMVLAAVLLVGGGAGAYLTLFSGTAEAAEAPEPGAVVTLEPITINLAEGHYLKLGMALQAKLDVAHEPEGAQALDLAITQYTGMKMGELSTAKGRDHAKKELLEQVKHAYHEDVYDLYFTQFVTQ